MQAHLNHHFSPCTERFFLEKKKGDKNKQEAFAVKKIYTICQVTGGTAFSKLSFHSLKLI